MSNRNKQCWILFYLSKYYLFSNKVCKMIYCISAIIVSERYANIKQSVETPNRRSFWIAVIADSYNSTYVLATAGPTSNTIATKLTDSLKSITSNISTSVQDTVDEVIADTIDIMIDNTMSKLENAAIYDNCDTSNIKFEPNVPSGIDMSQSSN